MSLILLPFEWNERYNSATVIKKFVEYEDPLRFTLRYVADLPSYLRIFYVHYVYYLIFCDSTATLILSYGITQQKEDRPDSRVADRECFV